MPSPQSFLISLALRHLVKSRSRDDVDVPMARTRVDRWVNLFGSLGRLHQGLFTADFQAQQGPVLGEWALPRNGSHAHQVVLYLHGGGYFFCSPKTHRSITSALAHGLQVPTLALQYRLAPEHPYPAALEDALAGYRWLLDQGYAAEHIAIAGDSAGGGLALALLVCLREMGWPLPAACALFCPWTDLAATGPSLDLNDIHCAMFSAEGIRKARLLYVGHANPYDPRISPLYADLRGLPPLFVHASDSEVLRDDSSRLAQKARLAGVNTRYKLWRRQPHVWQLFHRWIPEGRTSLQEAMDFLATHLGAVGELAGLPYEPI